jgi:peptidoglycan/xylan/chitin deacetylase (PgdA/CDA1 family)
MAARRLLGLALAGALAPAWAAAAHPRHHRQPGAPDAQRRAPETGPPEVLFTFDDGPHLTYTPRVLAELQRRNVKAVFFVNGWHFDRDPRGRALVHEEAAQGHYVGNHTYSHRILCKHLKDAPREIDRNEDLLQEVLGFRPVLLRTPYGQHCKALVKLVAERGYEQIGWDIDAQEWRPGKRAADVARFIIARLAKLHGRATVLLHDTHADTVEALPIIFDWLAQHPEIKVLDWHALVHTTPGAGAQATGQPTAGAWAAVEWISRSIRAALARVPRGFARLAGAGDLVL